MPSYSFTLLDTFENCPRQAHERFWLKRKMPEGAESAEGSKVHKALERRVAEMKPLPDEYAAYEPLVRGFEGRGTLFAEKGLAVNGEMKPCHFWAPERFTQAKLDLLLLNRDETIAVIGDWKTGKPREKDLQMLICALMVMENYPTVQEVHGFNIWLKETRLGQKHSFDRQDKDHMWARFLKRVAEIEDHQRRNFWPARPSPLCGWCGIFECEHNKNRGAQNAAAS